MKDRDSRFIASGAYGCIYHPPYDCNGKDLKDTTLVTKLVKNDYTSQTEYDISTMLKNKDGFLLIEKKCPVSSKSIEKSMAKDCDLIERKDPHIKNKYLLLYSKYIHGTELANYMKINFSIKHLVRTFCFLCKQIEVLIDCKIIHHDLHFGNIMYDSEKKRLIIIDFGLSIIASKFYLNNQLNMPYLKDAIFTYTPTWQYFAIEEHLLGYLVHKDTITEDIIQSTVDIYLEDHIIRDISPEYCKKYKEETVRYFKKYANKPRDYLIKKFLSWWNTWDYFKISLHMMKIYIKMKVQFPELFMLLLLMIHPVPKYRPSVIEMNKNIQTLLKAYSPKINHNEVFDENLSKDLSVSFFS
jgi:serine/threonine protein kinase